MAHNSDMVNKLREAGRTYGGVRELARATGIDSGGLARFLNGKSRLRLDHAAALAEALGFELVRRRKAKRSKQ